MKVAILDDYQDVALQSADWSALPEGWEPVVFRDHLADEDALVERLQGFDGVIGMRFVEAAVASSAADGAWHSIDLT